MNHSALKTALLAFAALALVASSGRAQTALSYTNGDLMLGFIDPNVSTDSYLLNLGLVSQFTSPGSPFTVNLGGTAAGIGADLNTVFGSPWYQDGTLSWGAIAKNSGSTLVFLTDQNYSGPGSANDFTNGTGGNATSVGVKINALGTTYAQTSGQPNLSTANSATGYIQGSGTNTFAAFDPFSGSSGSESPSTSFSYNSSILAQDPNQATIVGTTLELEELNPANGAGNAPTDLGTFSIANPTGSQVVITYTPSAIPEPSSVALLGLGLVGFALRRPRRGA